MQKNKLKILIIGSGGREHAVGWKVSQSEKTGQIFFAPGNAGTEKIGINVNIKANDINALVEFVKKEKIDLTLALPDDPLALGIVDSFQEEKLRIWGPTKRASELEWSKAYAKDFMKKYHIPTAKYEVFSDFAKAKFHIEKGRLPIVVKASGLALGKGVIVAETKGEAIDALEKILIDKIFGASGNEVVIEEYLSGVEISIHALSDGKNYKIFPSSQDHKRIFDNDEGPNTGGMGVIAPLPFIDDTLMSKIEKEIVAPIVEGMIKEGRPFVGCIYPGIMLTDEGPKVFEINARLGDPEAQAYMRLLKTDFLEIVGASIDGKLDELEIKWSDASACNIALASLGYPGDYEKGKVITGIDEAEMERDIVVFHAGTKMTDGKLVTNGGRVLGVSAIGNDLKEVLQKTYKAIEKISYEGMQYRKDVGQKTLLISKQKC